MYNCQEKVRKAHPEFPVAKDHNDLRAKSIGRKSPKQATLHLCFNTI